MGYSDFFRKKQTQAQSFLSSGSLNYNPLPVAGSNTTGCNDSSGCGSGWACIGGVCVQEESGSRSGSGNTSGCGGGGTGGSLPGQCGAGTASYLTMDKDLAKVYTEALKNLKPGDVLLRTALDGGSIGDGRIGISLNGKCLKTGCSGTSTSLGTNDACCGKGRCCRLGSVVQCFCGECPPPPQKCSQFCTSYLASNGTSASGCSETNTCDECSFCTDLGNFAGTTCIPKSGTGPCWCDGNSGNPCDSCSECQESGTCEFVRENCYPTPIPPINEPDPDDPGDGSDPCAGSCGTITVCDGEPDPVCPPRHSCRQSGTIAVGARTCKLFEQCDKSDLPEECGFCDCNCNNDCPDCQICDSSSGVCTPDPICTTLSSTQQGCTQIAGDGYGYVYNVGNAGSTIGSDDLVTGITRITSMSASEPYEIPATVLGPAQTVVDLTTEEEGGSGPTTAQIVFQEGDIFELIPQEGSTCASYS